MSKALALEVIKLLSAVETALLLAGKQMPEHIYEKIDNVVEQLTEEVLK